MTLLCDPRQPGITTPGRAPSGAGTWTIDPSHSSVSFVRRKLGPWNVAGRLHCFGVIHLDELPPVGLRRFEQPSGLPVLTMALDLASVETHDTDLESRLRGPGDVDAAQRRWWTLRSESLEVLPTGIWRVMARLIANGSPSPLELRVAVDPAASSPDWLVLEGRGLLDRRALGIGSPGTTSCPQIRLDLARRARRVGSHPLAEGRKRTHTTGRPA